MINDYISYRTNSIEQMKIKCLIENTYSLETN